MSRPTRKFSVGVLLVAILCLGISNVLLIRQNLTLRESAAIAFEQRALRPGDLVPPMMAWSESGQGIEVMYGVGERDKIFLFLSPSCTFCHEQLPGWRSLVASLDRGRQEAYVVVGDDESRDVVRDYLDSGGLGEVPVLFAEQLSRSEYGLRYTPTTVLVAADGKVQEIFTGLWDESDRQELARFFELDPASR